MGKKIHKEEKKFAQAICSTLYLLLPVPITWKTEVSDILVTIQKVILRVYKYKLEMSLFIKILIFKTLSLMLFFFWKNTHVLSVIV